MASQRDAEEVEELLGRKPQGEFEVVVRSAEGTPMVIANSPLLDDGRPMPTRFWLIDRDLVKAIGRIESTGGVNQAEADVDPDELEACHLRHNRERAALLPDGYDGPKPYGGVGGTRIGVKCLHAHYANYLVNGDDPVGRWVHERLPQGEQEHPPAGARKQGPAFAVYAAIAADVELAGPTLVLHLGADETFFVLGDGAEPQAAWVADLNGSALQSAYVTSDPPTASELSSALSIVELHVTDVLREVPQLADAIDSVSIVGSGDVELIAAVELGVEVADFKAGEVLRQADAEDLFRTVAVESHADRVHNPGLPAERANDIVGCMCVLLETLRQLGIDELRVASVNADLLGSDTADSDMADSAQSLP